MAQDFAKKKNGSASKKSGGSGIPGWIWLIAGIITGAFAMFLVYLAGINPSKVANKATDTATSAVVEKSQKPAADEKPTFEFYDSLTNNEVIPPKAPAKPGNTGPTAKSAYILQVASFQKLQDADALKAKLILEGLDTHIEKINNKGETWHRVLVGPFTDEAKLAQAKTTLAQHNINPIVLQKKP